MIQETEQPVFLWNGEIHQTVEKTMSDKQIQEFLVNRIVDQLVTFLVEEEGMKIDEALEKVYSSHVYDLLQIKEGDLFSQSPSYVYELLKKEDQMEQHDQI